MNLMNLVSTIFVNNVEDERDEWTTVFTSDTCSGHSVLMPILNGPWDGWADFLVELGQDSRSYKSVFLPSGMRIVLVYWDYENEQEATYIVPLDRRDSATGCTDISGENGETITFHGYWITD